MYTYIVELDGVLKAVDFLVDRGVFGSMLLLVCRLERVCLIGSFSGDDSWAAMDAAIPVNAFLLLERVETRRDGVSSRLVRSSSFVFASKATLFLGVPIE